MRATRIMAGLLVGSVSLVSVGPALVEAGPIADFSVGVIPGPVLAEVQSVYDGDTMTVLAAIWPDQVVVTSVRLEGIDTPEMRGKCPEEKARATVARDRVRALVAESGSQVRLHGIQRGKYAGRVVARVAMADGRDISDLLVAEGLARPYDGRGRKPWCGVEGEAQ